LPARPWGGIFRQETPINVVESFRNAGRGVPPITRRTLAQSWACPCNSAGPTGHPSPFACLIERVDRACQVWRIDQHDSLLMRVSDEREQPPKISKSPRGYDVAQRAAAPSCCAGGRVLGAPAPAPHQMSLRRTSKFGALIATQEFARDPIRPRSCDFFCPIEGRERLSVASMLPGRPPETQGPVATCGPTSAYCTLEPNPFPEKRRLQSLAAASSVVRVDEINTSANKGKAPLGRPPIDEMPRNQAGALLAFSPRVHPLCFSSPSAFRALIIDRRCGQPPHLWGRSDAPRGGRRRDVWLDPGNRGEEDCRARGRSPRPPPITPANQPRFGAGRVREKKGMRTERGGKK